MEKWQRINYHPNLPLGNKGTRVTDSMVHRELSKNAAKEGMVLVKNHHHILPLAKGSKVALFGKGSIDYVKGGGGSGDVTVAYVSNLYDGMNQLNDYVSVYDELEVFYRKHVLNEYDKGIEPGLTDEPTIPKELINSARAYTDTAIISICRFSGEGWDRKSSNDQEGICAEPWVEKYAQQSDALFENGDFCLSMNEREMVNAVKTAFNKVVIVMNVGGMVDTNWFVSDDEIQSVLMTWQAGMEGGLAAAELICGIGNPSGKLVDTFAKKLDDYPSSYNFHESNEYVEYTDDIYVGYRYFETIPGAFEKVNYPFGYGLSYTTFDWEYVTAFEVNNQIKIKVRVTNTGSQEGKEVIQIYGMPPQGVLGKPNKNLVAFKKTRLLKVGETEQIILTVNINDLASYDDLGRINKSAFVLEKGDYKFFVGTSIREGEYISYIYHVLEDRVTKQLSEKIAPTALPKRMMADGNYEMLPIKETFETKEEVFYEENLEQFEGFTPQIRYQTGRVFDKREGIHLIDVVKQEVSLDEFMVQLSDEELVHLLGGQPNVGVANTFGFGNIQEYGIPNVMTADGPAGLRINKECGVTTTAWPCSTLLACTWDEELVCEIGEAGAKEVKENNLGIWLTPAVNIHRSPLCGRNFEYYSEDPYITGKLAAAMVKGIQSVGISATVKHFALNNKETNRKNSDSRVSERAAREIYLKGFEMVVKEANPWCVMSAYNLVNGQRTSENRELLEDILRDEWGFEGVVTTDWWTFGEHYKEVNAGNDIKMGCGLPDRLLKAIDEGALSREQMEVSVKRVLELIMKLD